MRLVITTMAWKRPEILEAWCKHILRIQKELSDEVTIVPHVCASQRQDPESASIVLKYPIALNYAENSPLGDKANKRLQFAKQLNGDYYLFLGSDDFITSDLIRYYLKKIEEGYDEIAPMDIFYVDSVSGKGAYSPGYVNHRKGEALAVGRCLSRKILEHLNWTLWNPNSKRGIDAHARDVISTVKTKKHYFKLVDAYIRLVDVKSEDSLSKFTMYKHWVDYPTKLIISQIPELHELDGLRLD